MTTSISSKRCRPRLPILGSSICNPDLVDQTICMVGPSHIFLGIRPIYGTRSMVEASDEELVLYLAVATTLDL